MDTVVPLSGPFMGSRPEGFIELDGEAFYLIDDADRLDPFLMSIIGSTDVWVFIASNGALTAGRRDPDHAILPYYTEDKVIDGVGTTGGVTLVRGPWGPSGETLTWEPGSSCSDGLGERRRWVAKSLLGDEVVLGEDRPLLKLSFRVSWRTSARFGLVRRCSLSSQTPTTVQVLDGLRNLVPAEATSQVQNELSVLLDAYKRSEIVDGLGMYSMSSRLTDQAAPAEALRATVAWRLGPPVDSWLASARQLETFRSTGRVTDDLDAKGVRGAFLATFDAELTPAAELTWTTVADTGLDTAAAKNLAAALRNPGEMASGLEDDLRSGRDGFRALLAGCDARELTADAVADAHHVASVAFNAMRGGVPIDGHHVHKDQLRTFLGLRNRGVAEAAESFLAALPDVSSREAVVAAGAASGDPDLERLTLEFLPLTFGRRHGDPSRPWNRFAISLTDASGAASVGYQGNWRDIFQNWEALSWAYPAYVEGMVAAFVDATTIDGYNPYRISHRGIDWEEPEPENPWANIGYWSDHQIVYLSRLIEASRRFHPGALVGLLERRIFTTADVPYRLARLDATLAHPLDTVTFDVTANTAARRREAEIGGDGLLRRTATGDLYRSTLAEKLLLLLAAKMVNFVPDAGIWMNTQRPEWNDANNALVGRGASVVTTAQLLKYVALLTDLLGTGDHSVSVELADLIAELVTTLGSTPAASGISDADRRDLVERLGRAGETYRTRVYGADSNGTVPFSYASTQELLTIVGSWLEATLRANRRDDGLFHSYNTLAWDDTEVRVRRLTVMLEGQVAVLGSGVLDAKDALALVRAIRDSDLYRADQHSYLLYPTKDLPGFLERNTLRVRPDWASLASLLADPARRILVEDASGDLHFAADLANAGVLAQRLDELARDPRHPEIGADRAAILEAYEETFHHSGFTGRSGTFFGYEGLGSIYWHMVSKLALSVRESLEHAREHGADAEVVDGLAAAYVDIRSGLGFAKDAASYGAFPADPYSHTPAHAGARQPGMTGQVKEDILNRLGELGLRVDDGIISLSAAGVIPSAWSNDGGLFAYQDVTGHEHTIQVPGDSFAFTFCQVPFVVSRSAAGVAVTTVDGSERRTSGLALSCDDSRSILGREGKIAVVRIG